MREQMTPAQHPPRMPRLHEPEKEQRVCFLCDGPIVGAAYRVMRAQTVQGQNLAVYVHPDCYADLGLIE